MDKELQRYYEDRFSTMSTQGWKDLIDDIDKIIKVTSNIENVNDERTLHFKKGELSILNWIKHLKSVSERAYEDLNNEGN